MAPWLVLLLPWSVLALVEQGEISGKGTNSGDIMDAIINQLVISMQREMENTDDSQNKEELPQEEGQYHLSTVIPDNWIRVIKKEMEKIGLMQKPGFDGDQKRAGELATRIIKKGGKEEDRDIKMLKRSFWMWERSLNRKAQSKPAWFVLPGAGGENPVHEGDIEKDVGGSLERKERDVTAMSENEYKDMQQGPGGRVQYNPMKSFWKWERALNSRPNLSNTAWFVLDQEEKKEEEKERRNDEMKSKKRGGSKSFQRWGNPLQQSLTIGSG